MTLPAGSLYEKQPNDCAVTEKRWSRFQDAVASENTVRSKWSEGAESKGARVEKGVIVERREGGREARGNPKLR